MQRFELYPGEKICECSRYDKLTGGYGSAVQQHTCFRTEDCSENAAEMVYISIHITNANVVCMSTTGPLGGSERYQGGGENVMEYGKKVGKIPSPRKRGTSSGEMSNVVCRTGSPNSQKAKQDSESLTSKSFAHAENREC